MRIENAQAICTFVGTKEQQIGQYLKGGRVDLTYEVDRDDDTAENQFGIPLRFYDTCAICECLPLIKKKKTKSGDRSTEATILRENSKNHSAGTNCAKSNHGLKKLMRMFEEHVWHPSAFERIVEEVDRQGNRMKELGVKATVSIMMQLHNTIGTDGKTVTRTSDKPDFGLITTYPSLANSSGMTTIVDVDDDVINRGMGRHTSCWAESIRHR